MTSKVESIYLAQSPFAAFRIGPEECMDMLIVNSFPDLGKLTALRFIEYVLDNPRAVVSLPTGKTPEYFIKWVKRILTHWVDDLEIVHLRQSVGMHADAPPSLAEVRFVQMDEFCPIHPSQSNAYNYYIKRFYLKEFGIRPENCLLIDTHHLITSEEELKNVETIRNLEFFCADYESKIRAMGGIDLFIGGIGPDGHVAFNIRGSDPNSQTRLLSLNYESLASSGAEAMGGMHWAKRKMVITIGLGTIVFNPNCAAIIFAAGEAKSQIIRDSVLMATTKPLPSHALRVLPNAKFYLTTGAAKDLPLRRSQPTAEQLDIETREVSERTQNILLAKLKLGQEYGQKKILHTEPHHDDIMLGYLPFILRYLNVKTNNIFACGTSGFNSVSNSFLLQLIGYAKIQANVPTSVSPVELFVQGVKLKDAKMIENSLGLAFLKNCGKCNVSVQMVEQCVLSLYPGQRENVPSEILKLKSASREFEAEVLWALLGCSKEQVFHLRLGFYTSDVFAPNLEFTRDACPILSLLNEFRPDCVTVALDPESSGPDTHYKMLQSVTAALEQYDNKNVRIIGYRNVWYKFDLWEATMVVPVSKAEMDRVAFLFETCYLSQKSAEFPSYQYDGPFSTIMINTWKEQLQIFKKCMPLTELPPDTEGLLFLKEMSFDELKVYSQSLKNQLE